MPEQVWECWQEREQYTHTLEISAKDQNEDKSFNGQQPRNKGEPKKKKPRT